MSEQYVAFNIDIQDKRILELKLCDHPYINAFSYNPFHRIQTCVVKIHVKNGANGIVISLGDE